MTVILDDPIIPAEPVVAGSYLTARQYAENHQPKISLKTVKRWLDAGELPGVFQDERGWWMIPADAQHTVQQKPITPPSSPQPGTDVVTSRPRSRDAVQFTPLTSSLPPELTPELIGYLPTFLTIPQAAYLLGISEGTIRNPDNRDYYQLHKVDRNLMMPLYRIKQLRGVS